MTMPKLKEHASTVRCPQCRAGACSILIVLPLNVEERNFVDRAAAGKNPFQLDLATPRTGEVFHKVFRCTACCHEWDVPWWFDVADLRHCERAARVVPQEVTDATHLLEEWPVGLRVEVYIPGHSLHGQWGEVVGVNYTAIGVRLDDRTHQTAFLPNELLCLSEVDEAWEINQPALELLNPDPTLPFEIGDLVEEEASGAHFRIIEPGHKTCELRCVKRRGYFHAVGGHYHLAPSKLCLVEHGDPLVVDDDEEPDDFRPGDVVIFHEGGPYCVLSHQSDKGWCYWRQQGSSPYYCRLAWTAVTPLHLPCPPAQRSEPKPNPRITVGSIIITCPPRLTRGVGPWTEKALGKAFHVTELIPQGYLTPEGGITLALHGKSLDPDNPTTFSWPARDCLYVCQVPGKS